MFMESVVKQAEIIHIDIIVLLFEQRCIVNYWWTVNCRTVFNDCFYITVGIVRQCQSPVDQITALHLLVPFYFPDLVSIVDKADKPVNPICVVDKSEETRKTSQSNEFFFSISMDLKWVPVDLKTLGVLSRAWDSGILLIKVPVLSSYLYSTCCLISKF